ncbi:MAG: hypothetical protein HY595_04575 [Candidatus Omnitrophica bacterium]|nr:hypothetical protein [Candidatus Omnitrophota bacterium]
MKTLIRAAAACILSIVFIEGMSCLALGVLALRRGHVSTYFAALLPHPAISRHVADLLPETFLLLKFEPRTLDGGRPEGSFDWHPLLGYYRPFLPDGTSRIRPTFQSDELVVYLLGGSAVAAGGISAHLQEQLQTVLKDHYTVRVINEGIAGYISTQEMVLLQTKILPFGNPHYVLAVDGYNDWLVTVYNLLNHSKEQAGVTEEIWPQADLSWFYYWFSEYQGRKRIGTVPGAFAQFVNVLARRILPHTYTGWLLNHIQNWVYIVLLPKFGVRTIDRYYTGRPDFLQTTPLPPERAALQAMNERMMAEACRARGARFFWVLQPGLPYRGDAMTSEERRKYTSEPPAYWQSLEHYYQDLRESARHSGDFWTSRFVDLSHPPPDQATAFFIDTVHLSDVGERHVAQSLAAVIMKDLAAHPMEHP